MELKELYAFYVNFQKEHNQKDLIYVPENEERVKPQRADRPIEKIYKRKTGKH